MKPVAFASIGECMIELSAGKGADWRMGFAGDTFNTAWYVRAMLPKAKRVAYVTALGDDPFSDKMRDFIAGAGVETDRIRKIRRAAARALCDHARTRRSAPSPIGAANPRRAASPTMRRG